VKRNVVSLSSAETEFLSRMAARGQRGFTVDEARRYWNDDPQTPKRLARLAEKGWLERLERGRYMIVPLEAGPDREWSEDAYILAGYLVDPAAVAYWSALHYWNLTEQVPRTAYVQTTAPLREHHKVVLGIRFRLVRLKEEKFFGLKRELAGAQPFQVTDPEKTLLDSLDRLDLAGGVHEAARALRQGAGTLDWDRLDAYLKRLGSGAVAKRLGFLVEALDVSLPGRSSRLSRWQQLVTSGISRLDPSSQRKDGRIVTRWGIRINVDEDALGAAL